MNKNCCLLVLIPLLLTFGCTSSAPQKSNVITSSIYQPGVPGGKTVESYQVMATVTGVDAATRQVSLIAEDGSRRTVTVGPEFRSFDQLKAGSKVKAEVTKEVIISLNQSATVDDNFGTVAETVLVTARVESIDFAMHRVTLRFPDGGMGTFPVRPDVDLAQQKTGKTVFIRAAQSVKLLPEQ